MNSVMGALQRLGKALMGAVAVMPVAAILMGVGYYIQSVGGDGNIASLVLLKSGEVILGNLGLIFAVAIAFGLAKDSNGAAALSGLIGFSTVTLLLSPEQVAVYKGMDPATISELEGDAALQWASQGWAAVGPGNVLFGILTGVLAAWAYNRFHTTKLPDFLAFFSGRRLVPILTSVFSIVLSAILYVLWPLIYRVLFGFGTWLQGLDAVGAGLYGFFNRLLIPTGLHHALNSIFWFDVIGINDIGKFYGGQETIAQAAAATDAATCPGLWNGQTCEVIGIIGQYQAGFFPIMMFGLPGAALAMYLRANTTRRKVTGSLMLAAALASFFTGVTEPLEFSFMFAAPLLYVVHALLTGLSLAIAAAFDWTSGFGFSAGFVDMVLSASNPLAHKWWALLIMGVAFFALYFVVFYFLIGWLNLKTPGREDEEPGDTAADDDTAAPASGEDRYAVMADKIIDGLGGPANISAIEHCTTRLRVQTVSNEPVSDAALRAAGAPGVIRPSATNVQVVVGPQVQFVYDAVADKLAHHDVAVLGETEE
ncbi:N-acetylglucosamine-specific PTS transporter subunit IIBC [Corynebacterium uterequi]|uniref:PTS system, N-acetylglucosamine-specific IIBC component n=1 Tax=Corynebacterium uterequi TaxID=1072256 RepID=A0A0G3HAS6_9CORY|nr:N-acetylglucosamine-specific PTS transporter subunit IIBC [Corynebacterium uterequi]AKK10449.1 PTS system, N-acetylglucosamine-specific IIBC component [Corynebacterium uterequi]